MEAAANEDTGSAGEDDDGTAREFGRLIQGQKSKSCRILGAPQEKEEEKAGSNKWRSGSFVSDGGDIANHGGFHRSAGGATGSRDDGGAFAAKQKNRRTEPAMPAASPAAASGAGSTAFWSGWRRPSVLGGGTGGRKTAGALAATGGGLLPPVNHGAHRGSGVHTNLAEERTPRGNETAIV